MFSSFPSWSTLTGGFVLPYELGEQRADAWGSWEHFAGKRVDDGKKFSVFRLTVKSADTLQLEAGRNAVKRVRVVRLGSVSSCLTTAFWTCV